jgi:hypothetical protein
MRCILFARQRLHISACKMNRRDFRKPLLSYAWDRLSDLQMAALDFADWGGGRTTANA